MEKNITIKIDPLGNPTIEANGFNGIGCEAATAPIEKALMAGDGSFTRDLKGDYYGSNESGVEQHQSW